MVRGQRICVAVKSVGDKVPVLSGAAVKQVAGHDRAGYTYTLFDDRIAMVGEKHTDTNTKAVRWHGEREWYIGEFNFGPGGNYFRIDEGPYEKLAAALVALKLRE